MTNNHGTACDCWQCNMFTVPVSTTAALPSPPAEPKCGRCGLMTPDLEVLRLHACVAATTELADEFQCQFCGARSNCTMQMMTKISGDEVEAWRWCGDCETEAESRCDDCLHELTDHDVLGTKPCGLGFCPCKEFVSVPPAEPKCERCGHEKSEHQGKRCLIEVGSLGSSYCFCDGYRPPTTEPTESEGKGKNCTRCDPSHRHGYRSWIDTAMCLENGCPCSDYQPPPPAESVEDAKVRMTDLIREIEDAFEQYEDDRPDDEQGTTQEWNRFRKVESRLENAIENAKAEAKRVDEQIERQTPAITERWISIETLPEADGEYFTVGSFQDGGKPWFSVLKFRDGKFWGDGYVVAWMPIPPYEQTVKARRSGGEGK